LLYAVWKVKTDDKREIGTCLQLLKAMQKRWRSAKHCHDVLFAMMAQIRHTSVANANSVPRTSEDQGHKRKADSGSTGNSDGQGRKTRRSESGSATSSTQWLEANQSGEYAQVGLDGLGGAESLPNHLAVNEHRPEPRSNHRRTNSNWSANAISPDVRYALQTVLDEEYNSAPDMYNQQALDSGPDFDVQGLSSGAFDSFSNHDSFQDTFVPTLIPNTGYHDMFEGVTWESLLNVTDGFNL
jgi:hypothetical protein